MAVRILKTVYANATVYNPGEVAVFPREYERLLIRERAAVPVDDAPDRAEPERRA